MSSEVEMRYLMILTVFLVACSTSQVYYEPARNEEDSLSAEMEVEHVGDGLVLEVTSNEDSRMRMIIRRGDGSIYVHGEYEGDQGEFSISDQLINEYAPMSVQVTVKNIGEDLLIRQRCFRFVVQIDGTITPSFDRSPIYQWERNAGL